MRFIIHLFTLFILLFSSVSAEIYVGIGKTDITPPIGTPSAGYIERKGQAMNGVHDPLEAIALFIKTENKYVVLCSVDNLGFTYEMVQRITQKVHSYPGLSECEIFIGSSHTHSGGGSYLDIPIIGELLGGIFDSKIRDYYENQTVEAIIQASKSLVLAKIGLGYGTISNISKFRSTWPLDENALSELTILKVTKLDNTPMAVLFNFPVHPTVLRSHNLEFSSDFVGYARSKLQKLLGETLQPLYFNGAQGDVNPIIFNEEDRFDACQKLGESLAESVVTMWNSIETSDSIDIVTSKDSFDFSPKANPFGFTLPLEKYSTEINLIVFNKKFAFLTMPGEMSCLYDKNLKEKGFKLGYKNISILGLTNDAHGYIILPEAWRNKTPESRLSFGGEFYGDEVVLRAEKMLKENAPRSEGPL